MLDMEQAKYMAKNIITGHKENLSKEEDTGPVF
jgi:hypothetical protein